MKDGTLIKGVEIANKHAVELLFGINGGQKKTTRYAVEKDTDEILKIIGKK